MALALVATVGGGAVNLYADVVTGVVVGAQLVNTSGQEVTAEYVSGATVVFRGTYATGTFPVTLAKAQQFNHTTATTTRASLTVRWP